VHGFPTFLVSVDGKKRLARGHRTYAQMVGLIDRLAAGGSLDLPTPALLYRVPAIRGGIVHDAEHAVKRWIAGAGLGL
jgi:hypothetical protein